jgi:hypothetical protein
VFSFLPRSIQQGGFLLVDTLRGDTFIDSAQGILILGILILGFALE